MVTAAVATAAEADREGGVVAPVVAAVGGGSVVGRVGIVIGGLGVIDRRAIGHRRGIGGGVVSRGGIVGRRGIDDRRGVIGWCVISRGIVGGGIVAAAEAEAYADAEVVACLNGLGGEEGACGDGAGDRKGFEIEKGG